MSGQPARLLLLDPRGLAAGLARQGSPLDVHRCHDVADLLGRAAAGAAEAALLAPGAAGLDALVVARLRSLGCRVYAIVADGADAELARRIGIGEHLAAPVQSGELLPLLQTSSPVLPAPRRSGGGLVAAVWGPPGAPGRTTAAALLAIGASRSGRVVVVDADLATGGWSLLSNRPCQGSGLLLALRRLAGGSPDVQDLLVPQAERIDLLPVAPDPQRWVEAAPAAMPMLLDALSQQADLVVVDVGADIRPAHPAYDIGWAHDSAALARSALERADVVAAVLSADPAGVHRFAAWWPVLAAQAAQPVVVANRVGVPRAGRRAPEQVAAVLAAIGATGERIEVPWDTRSADALLAGTWAVPRGWRELPTRLSAAVMTDRSAAA